MPSRARRLASALACAAFLAVLGGCSRSDDEKVRDTVEGFVNARKDADYQKVCDLYALSFRQDQGLVTNCAATLQSQAAGLLPQGETKIVSIKVKGDRASVELDASKGSDAPSRLTITLRRQDGDWKIASTT